MRTSQALAGALLAAAWALPIGAQGHPASVSFVENRGQWSTPARYVARSGPLSVGVEPGALVIAVSDRGDEELAAHLVRLEFEGANLGATLEGRDRQPGVRHYYLGGDPARWRTGVESFSSVLYRGLYEGVDLCVRGQAGAIEYDLLLEPGADLDQVRVRCRDIESLELALDGALVLHTGRGPLRQSPPRTWSVLPSGEHRQVECRFVRLGPDLFGFRAADRDPAHALVIDPGIEWCTYLGGDDHDACLDADLDPFGRVVLAGRTYSANFPASGALGGLEDAYVAVLDPDPTQSGQPQLIWALYLGGDERDRVLGVETDANGDVYVTGTTRSGINFPTTAGAYSQTPAGALDTFVSRFDSNGALKYSTLFGGAEKDWGMDIELQGPGAVTVVGTTESTDLPVTSGCFQPGFGGLRDYFVVRLNLSGGGASDLVYATYLGGTGWESFPNDINAPGNMDMGDAALDAAGDIYVAGRSNSSNYPTSAGSYQPGVVPGTMDAVITRLSPNGAGASDLVYSTYVGGNDVDSAIAIVVDGSGTITAGGYSYSSDFPTTAGSLQPAFAGLSDRDDAIVFQLDPSQVGSAQLTYSTYLGGDGWEWVGPDSLQVDLCGDLLVAGGTGAGGMVTNNFPITPGTAAQPVFGLEQDGYLVCLSPEGNGAADLKYGTFLGGSSFDSSLLAGSLGGARVALGGGSQSPDFPTTTGAFQENPNGSVDAVAAQIQLVLPIVTYCTAGTSAAGCQAAISSTGRASASAPSGFDLLISGVEGNKNGLYFFGTNGRQANPWGSGSSYQCVVPPVKRGGLLTGTGTNGTCDGSFSQDFNALWSGAPAKNPGAGAVVQAQLWYRDPLNTSNQPTSLSNAIEFTLCQ